MKNIKSMAVAAVLAVALVVPTAVLAADSCTNQAFVDFGNPLHQLTPDNVTIAKGGKVTFNIVGGGHRIVVYPVSQGTNRSHIAEDLFPNCVDPTVGGVCTTNSRYLITDAKGNLIIDTNPTNPPFPTSTLVNYPVARVAYSGDLALTAGSTYEVQFPKAGKYLVHCANRGHLNDIVAGYMFGFVNVIDCALPDSSTSSINLPMPPMEPGDTE